jgi:hypothetical protein
LTFPGLSSIVPLLKDLLDYTLVHRRGRDSSPDNLLQYVPNELPGASPIPKIIFLARTDLPRSQGLGLVQLGEHQSGSRVLFLLKGGFFLISCPLGFCLPGPGPRSATARSSHVSFQRFCATATLLKAYAYGLLQHRHLE